MPRKFDPEELVDANEVAAIIGVSHRNTVALYRRRHADFPNPVVTKSRCTLWVRSDVEQWRDRRRPAGTQ